MASYAQELLDQGWEKGNIEGRAKGREEGRAEMLIGLLGRRLGPVPDAVQARISDTVAKDPDAWLDTVISADSYAKVLSEDCSD